MIQEEKKAILQLMAEEILKAFNESENDPHQSTSTFFSAVERTIESLGFSIHDGGGSEDEEGFIVSFYDDKASYEIWEADENCSITDYERYAIMVTDHD